MERTAFYITTPIYYVNDLPHIGHIYTTVVADVVARYKRARGFDVRFLTGTDEHGQKIVKAAQAQGLSPKELADRVVQRYPPLWRTLGISNDDFIRTSEARHRAGVHEMIRRMQAQGDIYKGVYGGWYCAGCEAFFPETQLMDGKCPDQGHPVEWLEEASYFFRLSAYQERLLRFYAEHPDFVRPESRFNEVVRFVEMGLKDLSVSRVSLSWGVPWPGDQAHVVYVWLDALTNYVSALGFGQERHELFERYWPADLHLVGKDILRFHCVYWPAFLMSAGLPLPRQVYGHGWWLRDDRKMSKSLGNVVRPDDLVARFGADPLRYFMLREMTFGQDASFSDEGFLQRYNADLANGLGNAASRVLAMVRRYFAGKTPPQSCSASVLRDRAEEVLGRYLDAMDGLEFHRALEAVWELLGEVDGYINDKQPWAIYKLEGPASARLARILYNALEAIRLVAVMLAPVMPTTAERLLGQMGIEAGSRPATLPAWGELPTEVPLGEEGALFPRVDLKEYFAEVTMEEARSAPAGPLVAEQATAEEISIDEFARVRLVVGLVLAAARVPKSKKLIRMEVDLGEGRPRQIVAGIGARYQPEELAGRRAVFVANLKPATLMGVESQGMVLAASVAGEPFLLAVDGDVPPGTVVK